jgi:hypothetical protein
MSTELKKPVYQNNISTISKINESSTIETLPKKAELDDSLYEHFLEKLTISKFNQFSRYCKEKEIENLKHDMKLRKSQFMQIMKNVFPGLPEFYPLYEKIFHRFRLLKCKVIYNPLYDNYFINSIYSNEEIDIYEISCAFACFLKCFFEQKLKILFDLSDPDEDGFINEIEVKKMIYTINYIFNREDNSIGTDSAITNLSLASLKAKKSFNLIMRHPGNLSLVIQQEKYISFKKFLSAVENVYNYKYSLMPLFISLKYSLNINRNEKEFEINKNNFNDYSKILKEIFTGYRKQGYIGTSNYDFKSSLELEKNENNRYGLKKNKNHKNKSQIKTGSLIMNSQYSSIGTLSNDINNSSINFNNASKKIEQSFTINNNININKSNNLFKKSPNLRYNVYYNRICGLEVYPAQFKEIEKDYKDNKNITTQNRTIKRKTMKDNRKLNNQGYLNTVEILEEIGLLINKQRILNSDGILLSMEGKEIEEENAKYYEKMKDPKAIIPISTLKPYIFEDIFQKKLKGK